MKHVGEVAFSAGRDGTGCQRLAFLLLGGFTHLAFACAVEPLRLANLASGRRLFDWRTLSFDGRRVKSSSGVRVEVDGGLGALEKGEALVVVGGLPAPPFETERVIARLRHERAHGRPIMALCGGVTVIAQAGFADDMDCAVHWQIAPSFAERFPKARISLAAFELGRIPTASGGTAAADLMLAMIRERHGDDLGRKVADLMVHYAIRDRSGPQTSSLMYHVPGRNPKLASVIRLMEETMDAPLAAEELAGAAGVSVRQMERLFRRYLGTSPKRHYKALRLNRARDLLVQSDLSISEIAVATGFAVASHFSRCFMARFGTSPYGARSPDRPLADTSGPDAEGG